jgi:hypothetical protein
MSELTIVVYLALAFAVLLIVLLRPDRRPRVSGRSLADQKIESMLPKHYRFFPQIQRALSAEDTAYLREMAPPDVAHQALRERRAIARRFLQGLHTDFAGLEQLARVVASLSPVLSRKQETERLLLGLRFRILYSVVCLKLSLGEIPLREIEQLTGLVGRLALRMEHAMEEVGALAANRLPSGLNA